MPGVIPQNVLLVWKKVSHDVLSGFSLARVRTKVQLANEKEAHWPDPFGTLVIIMTSSVVIVVIIPPVMNVGGIKSFYSH